MNRNSITHKIFIITFVVIISTPLILFALRIKIEPEKNSDKKISLNFKRNFPLRDDLIKINNKIKTTFFNTHLNKDKVVVGLDGWSFVGNSYGNAFIESKGFLVFSEKELAILEKSLKDKRDFFKKNNIDYYIAVAPNKLSVYGDKIPIRQYGKETKFNQFEKLCKRLKINFINLGKQFPKPPKENLYYKTDTHWTAYGGLYGFNEVYKHIIKRYPNENLRDYNLEDVNILKTQRTAGDISDMLFAKRTEYMKEFNIKNLTKITVLNKTLPIPKGYKFNPLEYESRFETDANSLKIMILNDSFIGPIKTYFINNFGESLFLWEHNYRYDLIKSEKPNIFLHEIVERSLDEFLK